MKDHDVFWKLEALSDRQLLERVGSILGSSRRLMAELIANLGEIEERRLHLASACNSMFSYCLKLGMTEDKAYRRIEVARLTRRYPAIFPLLANGQLSISVVALLKHHLSEDNQLDLLAAAAGKTVLQTRELIAARFPRPNVASGVRKLPERRELVQAPLAIPDLARRERHRAELQPGSMSTARAAVLRPGSSTTIAAHEPKAAASRRDEPSHRRSETARCTLRKSSVRRTGRGVAPDVEVAVGPPPTTVGRRRPLSFRRASSLGEAVEAAAAADHG